MSILNQITERLNLRWAWEKAKGMSYPGDVWIDEVELSEFEINLEENLESIENDLRVGAYRPKPIKPMPFPKHKDNDGNERVRQYFRISIRDQVAWIAVVNIIGPLLDWAIPKWSYGNRLYRSIWVEEDEGGRKNRRVGRYRNSSGKLYLPFRQSWPIFKRHVYLTTRVLSRRSSDDFFTEEDQQEYDFSLDSPKFSCQYLFEGWWSSEARKKDGLYWCSIDLEKFFPSIKREEVIKNIVTCVPKEEKESVGRVLNSIFNFKIDRSELKDEDLLSLDLSPKIKNYNHIPTGLFVSGFLSNAGMMRIDRYADKEVNRRRTVAHFRYVDDHIFVSSSFEELVSWVEYYSEVLRSLNVGAKINKDKIEPVELGEYLNGRKSKSDKSKDSDRRKAEEACAIDPDFPSPLMTKTLSLVSSIGKTDFNFLEDVEIDSTINQLEHLLLVDIPETEVPEKTRLAFSAAQLASIAQIQLEKLEVNKSPENRVAPNQTDFRDKSGVISESKVANPVDRIFKLIIKVLRRRPDRVRLWTRAIVLCRQTGVEGLRPILNEIDVIKPKNRLCHYYLMANFLTVVSSNLIVASSVCVDDKSTGIKRTASLRFIESAFNIKILESIDYEVRHELKVSLKQFYLSMYVAASILEEGSMFGADDILHYKSTLKRRFVSLFGDELSVGWVWWVAKVFLRDMRSSPNNVSVELSSRIADVSDIYSFWRFFPGFVPKDTLLHIVNNFKQVGLSSADQGWLLESIRGVNEDISEDLNHVPIALKVYSNMNKKGVDLYQWVEFCNGLQSSNPYDPRIGEWTALEIVRQCVSNMDVELTLDGDYLNNLKLGRDSDRLIHPANILIPDSWLAFDPAGWESWFNLVGKDRVKFVGEECVVSDSRFHPDFDTLRDLSLSRSIGLVLYGLLKKKFSIPSIWNGLGHEDVLKKLPSLLLGEITFSTITLGFLEGCLSSRVLENVLYEGYEHRKYLFDDDDESDPIYFVQIKDILFAIELSQKELMGFQESLSSRRASQVTPIDVELLTKVSWADVFNAED